MFAYIRIIRSIFSGSCVLYTRLVYKSSWSSGLTAMFQYFNLVSMCLSILLLETPIVAPWLPISKGIGHNHSFLQQWILIVGIATYATCPFLSAFRLFVRFFGISHSLSNCLAPAIFRWISVNLTYFPNNSNAWQIENIPTPHPVTLYTTSSRKKKHVHLQATTGRRPATALGTGRSPPSALHVEPRSTRSRRCRLRRAGNGATKDIGTWGPSQQKMGNCMVKLW